MRIVAGAIIATAIAFAAFRAHALSRNGAITAILVGTICVAAGADWGALLVVWFAASSAITHLGRATKQERTREIIEKSGPRDAIQVLANGGIFATAALVSTLAPDHLMALHAIGAGALAAAASDTWATEIGTLWGGAPRSIVGWRVVPPGTSGGITVAGMLGSVAGAAFVATCVLVAGWGARAALAAGAGGMVGALTDSLLGATVQQRRHCSQCDRETERRVHHCGTPTTHHRGTRWLGNDLVNLSCTAAGAVAALVVR